MKLINKVILGFVGVGLVGVGLVAGGAVLEKTVGVPGLDAVIEEFGLKKAADVNNPENVTRRVLSEESVVIDVADKASPAVVTVGIKKTQKFLRGGSASPLFDPWGIFNAPQVDEKQIERDIGTGFIVRSDGLIVTNRHVVDDREAEYVVFTNDNKQLKVDKIDRDPINDLAILKVEATNLPTMELGDSSKLKVGQFAIAIGTALGEFRHTVTTGVISGLGRGITAGDVMGSSSEELENVIQTDAAINPGNSGGPLLNSLGQVIGVNVAVSQQGQNIGFALPINLVKEALDNFTNRGGFGTRGFLGVQYKMITQEAALLNDVPRGALLTLVQEGAPADKAGLQKGDVVIKVDGKVLSDQENGLASILVNKKAGDTVEVEYYRINENTDKRTVKVTLEALDS